MTTTDPVSTAKRRAGRHGTAGSTGSLAGRVWKQRWLFFMVLPGFLVLFVFNYLPMYGLIIAFQKWNPMKGILGSQWVGMKYFVMFFGNPMAVRIIRNTLLLGIYSIIFSFPPPIILAVLFNQLGNAPFKRVVQSISYFPHFVSTVIIVGILLSFTTRDGFFNSVTRLFGMAPVNLFAEPRFFRSLYIGSGIWQSVGWGSILYLASLSGVDPNLYDAASIDGANRWRRVLHVEWPHMQATAIILLIFRVSAITATDYQKVLLMYNPGTYEVADVIGTYVYREGIAAARFEYATAVGLLNSVFSAALLLLANGFSRRVSQTSLW
jgi:putative aldouronate transport system permease protein